MSLKHEDYIKICQVLANVSYCKRSQVGAILVKQGNIICQSYNGTIAGRSNDCEDDDGNTKREVCHAEANLICKVAQSTQSCFGASLYTTLAPCIECAKLIVQAGILEVYYLSEYRDPEGISLLKKCGIDVYRISVQNTG
jgi:dCMP deaminase